MQQISLFLKSEANIWTTAEGEYTYLCAGSRLAKLNRGRNGVLVLGTLKEWESSGRPSCHVISWEYADAFKSTPIRKGLVLKTYRVTLYRRLGKLVGRRGGKFLWWRK